LNINDYINWQAKGVLNQSKSSYSFDGKEYNQLGRAGVGLIEQRGNHTESGSATSHFVLSYRHDGPVWHANALAYYSKSIRRQGDMKEDGMMENVTLRKQNLTIDYLHVTGGARAPTVVAKTATGAIVDGFSLNDMTMGELTSRDNRNTDELRRGIKANVRRSFRGAVPVTVKSGFDLREQTRDHDGPTRYWTFVGPDGRANTADDFASLYDIRMVNITSPGWGFPVRERVDNWKTYQLFRAHPEYFLVNDVSNIQSAAKESFYLKESIRAGYLMADVSMAAKRLRIVGGIRYEETRNTGIGRYFDPILGYQRDASGNIIRDSKGIPLKIVDPVVYARVTNVVRGQVMKSSYDGLYPSVNATYAVTENALARVSFSRTLGRPNLSRLFPNTEINDTARTISATSSSLSPWTCDSVDASLEYYFRTGGLVSVGAFRKNIADIFGRITETATPELLSRFDLDPVVYAGYDLTQYLNVGDARVSGMEASFTQDLGPLHPLLKGFSLFANGSVLRLEGDNTADFQGYAPRMGNLGLSYDRSRFNIQLKANYIGRQQRSPREWPNSFEFRMASTKLDLNAQYRITKRLALFVSGRNITNEKDVLHWASPETPAYARLQREMDSGALWSIGVKGEF
jgi:TonB-dependent receptor